MDPFEAFSVPRRSELRFGEPLEDVCGNGLFHDGLRDLFLKAYLSARGDEDSAEPKRPKSCPESAVRLALKPGPAGQGSLSQRLSLKSKLESGEWLLPAQTPPGSALWLLRHFLGRLPRPLLQGPQWRILGRACTASAVPLVCGTDASRLVDDQLLERIAAAIGALSPGEARLLSLVALLTRKLATRQDEIVADDLEALGHYFVSSIIARPFRPGLYTPIDQDCQPLLIVLAARWDQIFLQFKEPRPTANQLIGFESLLIAERDGKSMETPANDDLCNGGMGRKSGVKTIDTHREELESVSRRVGEDVPALQSEHEYFSVPNSEDSQ